MTIYDKSINSIDKNCVFVTDHTGTLAEDLRWEDHENKIDSTPGQRKRSTRCLEYNTQDEPMYQELA